MYLTKENYNQIVEWIKSLGRKDTDYPLVEALNDTDTVVVVKDGYNKRMYAKAFAEWLDYTNYTDLSTKITEATESLTELINNNISELTFYFDSDSNTLQLYNNEDELITTVELSSLIGVYLEDAEHEVFLVGVRERDDTFTNTLYHYTNSVGSLTVPVYLASDGVIEPTEIDLSEFLRSTEISITFGSESYDVINTIYTVNIEEEELNEVYLGYADLLEAISNTIVGYSEIEYDQIDCSLENAKVVRSFYLWDVNNKNIIITLDNGDLSDLLQNLYDNEVVECSTSTNPISFNSNTFNVPYLLNYKNYASNNVFYVDLSSYSNLCYQLGEAISTLTTKVNSIFAAGYYYSTSDVTVTSDNWTNYTDYIGTYYDTSADDDSLDGSTYYAVWYSNDGETWTLIRKYVSEESLNSSYIYFRSSHIATMSLYDTEGNVISNTQFPAGYIEVSVSLDTYSNAVFTNFISTTSITTDSLINEASITLEECLSVSIVTQGSIPSQETAYIYLTSDTIETKDFIYVWYVDTTATSIFDTIGTGSEEIAFPELLYSTGTARSLVTAYNFPVFGNFAGLSLGSHFCYVDNDDNLLAAVVNFSSNSDSTADRWFTSVDSSTELSNYGYYYNWDDPYYILAFIQNTMSIFYTANSAFFSEALNKFIVNYDGSCTITGAYGGSAIIGLQGNEVDSLTFYPKFSIFAHLGIVPASDVEVTLQATFLVGGKDDYLKQATVINMANNTFLSNTFFKIYEIVNCSVRVRTAETDYAYNFNTFYPYGDVVDTQQDNFGDYLEDYNCDYRYNVTASNSEVTPSEEYRYRESRVVVYKFLE